MPFYEQISVELAEEFPILMSSVKSWDGIRVEKNKRIKSPTTAVCLKPSE